MLDGHRSTPIKRHSPMNTPRLRNAARRLIGVALLALLVGQWTALAHSIGHAHLPARATLSVDDHDAWGHEAGAPSCQLVDHLLVGQATGGDPAPLLWLPPAATLLAAPAPSIAPGPASRAFEARGPPRA
jgi:hypothetical protein